jgi:putative hydrolase of the HAD superfamily
VIKAIIFDYGGVFSAEGSLQGFGRRYAPKFGKEPEVFASLITKAWGKARVNAMSSGDFWKELGEFLGVDAKIVRRDVMEAFWFKEDVFALAKQLGKHYKLGLLSNHIEDWLEEVIKNHRLEEVFDVILPSYMAKVAKPDITIFKEMVKRLGVKPSECIYIDDMKKNIPTAEGLGMKAILFTDLESLKKQLALLSVK